MIHLAGMTDFFQISLQKKVVFNLPSKVNLLGIGLRLSPVRDIDILLVCTKYNIFGWLVAHLNVLRLEKMCTDSIIAGNRYYKLYFHYFHSYTDFVGAINLKSTFIGN